MNHSEIETFFSSNTPSDEPVRHHGTAARARANTCLNEMARVSRKMAGLVERRGKLHEIDIEPKRRVAQIELDQEAYILERVHARLAKSAISIGCTKEDILRADTAFLAVKRRFERD